MNLPPVQPRSRLAHQAAQWARAQNRFNDYNEELFRAFFERGENIGEIDVLVSLAVKLDFDGGALETALENKEFEQSVIKDEETAAEIGISGVPAFVANRKFALTGVQNPENLRMLIARA